MESINDVLKKYIIEEFLSPQGIHTLDPNFPLLEEGIVDSLRIFMLINFINEQFGVKIQPEDVIPENFQSLQALTDLVVLRKSTNIPI